ncbi:mucin-6 [Cygnus olor]|uniref:mucin-6 n=1 Tax=Cygnus olor TaxID=8869 RepID=UPI001ADEB99C|nr:mucin-6 [Cygnus olor]
MSKDSCSTWGGGHFSTFDKYQYDFTGTCNYIFATVCDESSPDFNVQFRRGLDKKIARIIIELGPSVIIVEKDSISVRSVGVIKLPYASNGIQIAPYGRSIRLVAKLMEMELVVMWNNEDYLMVLTEKKYMGKTCGMCGNYDGYELNDFVSEGKLLDAYKFAALQKMDDPSEICLSEEIPIPTIPHKKYAMICSQLFNLVSPTCSVPKDGFVIRCQLDMQDCSEPGQKNCTCSTLSEYSRQCAMSHQVVLNWRTENFCSVGKCSANQIYEECGSPCIKTCSNPEYSCSSHCTYGCFCPEGTVLDDISKNRTCVHLNQCPCMLNGETYAPGETMKAACRTCKCTMGQWNCKDLPCPGRCSLEGGSFVTTFDSRSYRFHGVCTYILMKSSSLPNNGTLMAVYEKSGYSHSETSLSAIIYLSTKDRIVISQNELLTDDDELKRLPYRSGDITIFKQSSMFIQIHTVFDLEVLVQTSPVFQAYVKVGSQFKGRTLGLCGNYNGDTTDDFMTSMDITEGTASLFVDSWRAGNCNPALERETDPCALSQLNKISAETHCSILTKKGTVFEKCHTVVNPIPFYKRCVYQACNYEETFPYICSALGSYARTCSSMGLILENWRDSMDNCTIPCTGNQTFSYNTQACDRTCLSLSYRALECHPTDIPIEGCHCPKGTYLNHKNECVRKSHCPCYLEDRKYILPDQSTMSGGITCYCVNGRLSCTGKPQNPAESCRAPKKYISCSDNLENKYGATCAPTCQMLATGIECIPTKCESGCVCADGLYENLDGRCVPAEDCPCEYGGLAYGKGEQIQTECEICTCRKGKWKCVQKSKCSSTCNLYGEGHITTFDGQRFVFDGNCEYILAMDGCSVNRPHSSFKIVTENVICGKSGVTCSRSISIYLGNLTLVLRDETFSISGENPLVRYNVKKNALHLMFDIVIPGKYNMTLIWNKHMNFFIKISRETQETICGLCGNYNGNMKDDFETRSKYVASNELEFVNSWKENPLCGDVYFVVDPCSKNPYRKAWAEKTCSIINSQVFSACHNKVNRMPYYEACVRDSCGCDIGGDCECMCDAIAVYAMACLDKGICIDWRTPEFCPVYCEYYNSHRNSGSGGALSYAYNNDNCTWHYRPCNCPNQNYKYVNIEGCYNCSHDEYFDYEKEKCMPCGYESISITPETSPLTVTTVQPNITRSSTAVTSPATILPTSPAITSSASTVSTETTNPTITSKITIPRTSSATPLVTIKSTTEHTTLVFTTPSMTTTVTTPSITTSTKRTTSTKPISTPTASLTTASTETEKVRVTTPVFETPTKKEMTTTSMPSHITSQIATSSQPELTTVESEGTEATTLHHRVSVVAVTHKRPTVPHTVPQFITRKTTPVTLASSTSQTSVSREASPASSPEVPLTKMSPSPSSLPVTSASSVSSSSSALPSTRLRPSHPAREPTRAKTPTSKVVTASKTTLPPVSTEKTTPATSASSTSKTSVPSEASPASSPAVPLPRTSPAPSSPLSTRLPSAAPFTVSSPWPPSSRPKPTPTTLRPKPSPPRTSAPTESPASSAPFTAKTSPLPSAASSPFSIVSSAVPSSSHPGQPWGAVLVPPLWGEAGWGGEGQQPLAYPSLLPSETQGCVLLPSLPLGQSWGTCPGNSAPPLPAPPALPPSIPLCFPPGSLHPQEDNGATHRAAREHGEDHPGHVCQQHVQDLRAQRGQPRQQPSSAAAKDVACPQQPSQHQAAICRPFHSLLPVAPKLPAKAHAYDPEAQALSPEDQCSHRVACVLRTLHSQNQPAALGCVLPLLNCVLNSAELLTSSLHPQEDNGTTHRATCEHGEDHPGHVCQQHVQDLRAQRGQPRQQPSSAAAKDVACPQQPSQHQAAICRPFHSLLPVAPKLPAKAHAYDPEAQALSPEDQCSHRVACVLRTLHSQNQPAALGCVLPLLNCVLSSAELLAPCLHPQEDNGATHRATCEHGEDHPGHVCQQHVQDLRAQRGQPRQQPSSAAAKDVACPQQPSQHQAAICRPFHSLLPVAPKLPAKAHAYDPEAQALSPEDQCSHRVACVLRTLHSQNQPAALGCVLPLLNCVLSSAELLAPCLHPQEDNGTTHRATCEHGEDHPGHVCQQHVQDLRAQRGQPRQQPSSAAAKDVACPQQPSQHQAAICRPFHSLLPVAPKLPAKAHAYDPEAQALSPEDQCSHRVACVLRTLHSQNQPAALGCVLPLLNCVLSSAELLAPCLHPQEDNGATHRATCEHGEDHPGHVCQQHVQDLRAQRGQPRQQPSSAAAKDVACPQQPSQHQAAICRPFHSLLPVAPKLLAKAHAYNPEAQALSPEDQCSHRVACILRTLHSQNQPAALGCVLPLLNCVLSSAELLAPCLHPQEDNGTTHRATCEHGEDHPGHVCQQHVQDLRAQRGQPRQQPSSAAAKDVACPQQPSQHQAAICRPFHSLLPVAPKLPAKAHAYDPEAQALSPEDQCSHRVACVLRTLHSQNQPAALGCVLPLLNCVLSSAELLAPCLHPQEDNGATHRAAREHGEDHPGHVCQQHVQDLRAQRGQPRQQPSSAAAKDVACPQQPSQHQAAICRPFHSLLPVAPKLPAKAHAYDPEAQALSPEDQCSHRVACVLRTLHSQNQPAALGCVLPLLNCVLSSAELLAPCLHPQEDNGATHRATCEHGEDHPGHVCQQHVQDLRAQRGQPRQQPSSAAAKDVACPQQPSQHQAAICRPFHSLLPVAPKLPAKAHAYDPEAQALSPEDQCSHRVACVLRTLHSQNQPAALGCVLPLLNCILSSAELLAPCLHPQEDNGATHRAAREHGEDHPGHVCQQHVQDLRAQRGQPRQQPSSAAAKDVACPQQPSQHQAAICRPFHSLLPVAPKLPAKAHAYDPEAQALSPEDQCSHRVACILRTLHSQNQPAALGCVLPLLNCVLSSAELLAPCLHPQEDNGATHRATCEHGEDHPGHVCQQHVQDLRAQRGQPRQQPSSAAAKDVACPQQPSQHQAAICRPFHSLLPVAPKLPAKAHAYDPEAQALSPEDQCSHRVACVLRTLHSQNQPAALGCVLPLLNCVLSSAELLAPCLHPQEDNGATHRATCEHGEDHPGHVCQQHVQDLRAQRGQPRQQPSSAAAKDVACPQQPSQHQAAICRPFHSLLPVAPKLPAKAHAYDPEAQALSPEDQCSHRVACVFRILHSQNQPAALGCVLPLLNCVLSSAELLAPCLHPQEDNGATHRAAREHGEDHPGHVCQQHVQDLRAQRGQPRQQPSSAAAKDVACPQQPSQHQAAICRPFRSLLPIAPNKAHAYDLHSRSYLL